VKTAQSTVATARRRTLVFASVSVFMGGMMWVGEWQCMCAWGYLGLVAG